MSRLRGLTLTLIALIVAGTLYRESDRQSAGYTEKEVASTNIPLTVEKGKREIIRYYLQLARVRSELDHAIKQGDKAETKLLEKQLQQIRHQISLRQKKLIRTIEDALYR